MTVIDHDFDGARRRLRMAAHRFAGLLKLDALHEANIQGNPVPYLERAAERIDQLEKLIFDALQASTPAVREGAVVEIDRADLDALLACRAILARAITDMSDGGEG